MRKLAFLLALSLPLPLLAQPAFEKILLPVVVQNPVAGALGSLWNTELDLFYGGNGPLNVGGIYICHLGTQCAGSEPLEPKTDYRNVAVINSGGNPGAFLVVPVESSRDLAVHLRVFDISRATTNRGTEVPAIRESAAWTTQIQLLDIATAPPFRSLVRIYDFDPSADHSITLNVYAFDRVVETRTLALLPASSAAQPGYADFDLSHLASDAPNVRVELIPLSAGLRFWAMASTTNNETQHVTLTTP